MSELLIYTANEKDVTVRLEGETVWLTQDHMARLFERERSVISKHMRNVFKDGELDEAAVCANFAHTATDGKTYQTRFFNLDAIISIGYRVKSVQGLAKHSTRVARRRLPICSISLSRITRFPMATSVSARSCSCSICSRKICQ